MPAPPPGLVLITSPLYLYQEPTPSGLASWNQLHNMVEYFRSSWGEDWVFTDEVATFQENLRAMPSMCNVDNNEEATVFRQGGIA